MNNFSQETPSRKPRTEQCGKRKRNPDEFELRIMKALEEGNQPNRHLSFFTGIIPAFQTPKAKQLFQSASSSVQPAISYFLTCWGK